MKPIVIIVTASAVLFGGILPGQSDESESTHNADPFHPKTTVVVTATRSPVPSDESGAAIATLSGAELDTMRPVAANDALRFLPGAVVATAGSSGGSTRRARSVRRFPGGQHRRQAVR